MTATHTFAILGDWGDSSTSVYKHTRLHLRHLLRRRPPPRPDAQTDIILTGDNLYPAGAQSWLDAKWVHHFDHTWNNVRARFVMAVLGNHDKILGVPYGLLSTAPLHVSDTGPAWVLPHTFYRQTFPHISMDLWCLDTCVLDWPQSLRLDVPCSLNVAQEAQEQLKWLDDSLQQSTARFKVCVGHYPVFSNGPHGGSKVLQDMLLPLFRKHHVDLYLCGHDHNLQWGLDPHGSTHFLVSGAASYITPPKDQTWSSSQQWTAPGFGFWTLDVEHHPGSPSLLLPTCHFSEDGRKWHARTFFIVRA